MNITKHAKNSFISYILQNEPQRTYTGDVHQTYIVLNGMQANYFKSITTALMHYKNECNYTNAAIFQCRAFFAKRGDDVLHVKRIV
jgi:hypothetical protein